MTILVFIIQFIGLRSLHAAVSVYQIAAVLIMSMLRTMLRTKRLDLSTSLFAQESKGIDRGINITGHELDCLAFEMYRERRGEPPAFKHDLLHTWTLLQCAGETVAQDTNLQMLGLERIEGTNMWKPDGPIEVRDWPKEEDAVPTAATIWRYRSRLGELTFAESGNNPS